MKSYKKHLKFYLGDIGNIIGLAIADDFSKEVGFSEKDLLRVIEHRISIN